MTDPQTPLEQLQAQWKAEATRQRSTVTEWGDLIATVYRNHADALTPLIEQQQRLRHEVVLLDVWQAEEALNNRLSDPHVRWMRERIDAILALLDKK